jgi:putative spermidine/putrescine transport system ATP-binding protein/spermidine/putrescine transport system ATP-binding protein
MDDRDVAVRLEDVTKDYGDVIAVDDISIDVHEGEFLTLLGPSGAGKTTLLHMIAGFVQPTRGDIYIDGDVITDKPPYERNIGMVFQSMALFPHMTVSENISFPLEMRRYEPTRIEDRVQEMLNLIGLPDIGDRDISALSGGQQQRVAVARGLAFEPSLLLLDEPLSSLDKKLREEMRQELLRIHREADVTTIHVTHNQEEALTMADRIAVINEGTVAQLSPNQELYARPNSAFVADFIGNTNLLDGHVTASESDTHIVAIAGEPNSISCRTGGANQPMSSGDSVTIGIRYELIQIGENLAKDNVYEATVEEVLFSGNQIHYTVCIAESGIQLEVSELNAAETRVLDRGETVSIGWNEEDTLLYPR